jgi:hypothetical protein
MKNIRLHPASVLVGIALAAVLGVTMGQNLLGAPAVVVRVLEVPTLSLAKDEVRMLDAPFLNASVQYIVQPGETINLTSCSVQSVGDSTQINRVAAFTVSINGGQAFPRALEANLTSAIAFSTPDYKAQPGDILEFKRVPVDPNNEADPNFGATVFFEVGLQ